MKRKRKPYKTADGMSQDREDHFMVEIAMMLEPSYPIVTFEAIAKKLKLEKKTIRQLAINMKLRGLGYPVLKQKDCICGVHPERQKKYQADFNRL